MSGGGGSNWNPGDALRQLSQNAGEGIGAIGNNFTQGAAALANNWNVGKGNAATNWNGITAGLGNGDNYNPAKGTLGALAQGFTNGGDFSNGMNQIQGGYYNQVAPIGNDYMNRLKGTTEGALAGEAIGDLTGAMPFGIGAGMGGSLAGLGENFGTGEDFTKNQSTQAAQRQQNDSTAAAQAQQQKTQATQQAQQKQQQQVNQANFNQQNSLEDALRAAALQRQGSRANANLAY